MTDKDRQELRQLAGELLQALPLCLLTLFLTFRCGHDLGMEHGREKALEEFSAFERDTVWRTDTVTIREPAPKAKTIRDTVWYGIPDTLILHTTDTAYVPVPIESTYYSEKDYEAWVSGFRASLDSIKIFNHTAVVETKVPVYLKKKWGIGFQAGATMTLNGEQQPKALPYIGFGVSYNIFSF